MEINRFKDHEALCDFMVEKAKDGRYIVAALYYEDAIKLARQIMRYEEIAVESLEVMPPEYAGYKKEYYVTIANDLTLSVEPAYFDDIYLNTEADLLLVDGEASSKILKTIAREFREIYIGNNEIENEAEFKDAFKTIDNLIEYIMNYLGEHLK